jgi:hypothetical protein
MSDSYIGFGGQYPSAIGTTANTGEGIITLSTMAITIPVGSDTIKLDYGITVPTTVNINAMPVINSLVNRTTDVFYNGSNLTTIDGNLDVNATLGVASNANINGNADINGTLNVDGNITMPGASQVIEINANNDVGWGDSYLNTNIYHGDQKGGTTLHATAPDFVSYPHNFTVGGLLYPATLIDFTSGILTLNGGVINMLGATLTIQSLAVALAGTFTVAGLATFNGATFHNGANSFTGVNTMGGATTITGITTITGALTASGTTFTATTGANTLSAGANTITAVGTNTITGGLNLITGGINTYTALQHYFVGDLVDFTNFIGSTCKLKVDTIQSGIGMELINVSSINGIAYPPPSSGAVVSTFNQLYTSSFKANTAQISSISSQQLFISSINGLAYPPPVSSVSTISSFNTASVSSLFVSSINNAVYPPPAGNTSSWASFPAVSTIQVPSPLGIRTNNLSAYTVGAGANINVASGLAMASGQLLSAPQLVNVSTINNSAYPPPAGNVSAWATFLATSSINALTYGIQTGYIDATNAPFAPFNILGFNNGNVRFQNIRNGTPGSAPTIEFSDGSLNLMRTIAMTANGAITNVSSINGVVYPPPPLVSENYSYTLPLPGLSTFLFSATLFPTIVPTPLTNGYNMTFFDGFGGGGTIFLKNCLLSPSLITTNYSYSPSTNSPPAGLGIATFGQSIYFINTSGGAFTPPFPTYAILTPVNYQ